MLEAQVFKTRDQFNHRQLDSPDYQGYCHVGYLKNVYSTREEAEKHSLAGLDRGLRLVAREYSDEFLDIDKPYVENCNRLASIVRKPSTLIKIPKLTLDSSSAFILEMQSELDEDIGWHHIAYLERLVYTREQVILEIDRMRDESMREAEHMHRIHGIHWTEKDYTDPTRYVVRRYGGEVRGIMGIYDR